MPAIWLPALLLTWELVALVVASTVSDWFVVVWVLVEDDVDVADVA